MKNCISNLCRCAIITALMSQVVACGITKQAVASGITINDDSSIQGIIIEEFDENQYSITELESFINSEVNDYNAQNGVGRVSAISPELKEGKVVVTMDYASFDDYAAFNNRRLQKFSLNEAISQGMLGVAFKDAKDGNVTDVSTVDKPEEYSLVITDEPGAINTPGKIAYVSDGVVVDGKTRAIISDDMDGLAYIIYSNK